MDVTQEAAVAARDRAEDELGVRPGMPVSASGVRVEDGRHTRWTDHRVARRRQLTDAAIAAIRRHGAAVGMDEIAAEAGTSKTVLYRHLGDRLGVYRAVCETVNAQILSDLHSALPPRAAASLLRRDLHEVLAAVIDAYLHLVERDPEVYRFVVRRPLLDAAPRDDPVAGLTDAIADTLSQLFRTALEAADADTAPAATWAYGLIGGVRESADRWLSSRDRVPREVMVGRLADFAVAGLAGVLRGGRQTVDE